MADNSKSLPPLSGLQPRVSVDPRPEQTAGTARKTSTRPVKADPTDTSKSSAIQEHRLAVGSQLLSRGKAGSPTAPMPSVASMEGKIDTPALVADPAALAAQIKDGALTIRMPLEAGATIGAAKVRPDTYAVAKLIVRNGNIDFEATRELVDSARGLKAGERDGLVSLVYFETLDGTPTNLDGPLWIDGEAIGIDAAGQIRAEVQCFPDPNITQDVLGEGIERMPTDVGELVRLLVDKTVAGSTAPADPSGSRLGNAFDLDKLRVDFAGELKPGPIRFGPDALLNLKQGATVTCSGLLSDLHADIEVPLRTMQLRARGTRLISGGGRAKLGIDFAKDGTKDEVRLEISDVELNHLDLTAEGRNHLNIQQARGGKSRIVYSSSGSSEEADLVVDLHELDFRGVTGQLEIKGADGSPSSLALGSTASGSREPINMRGRVELDTRDDSLHLVAGIDEMTAVLDTTSLIDHQNFKLELDPSNVAGAVLVDFKKSGEKVKLELATPDDKPVKIDADVRDAQLTSADGRMRADVGTESLGSLTLRALELSSDEPPVIDAKLALQVVMDELSVDFQGGHHIKIEKGTTGTLLIDKMLWESGAASPEIDALLRLSLGGKADVRPGEIPGLEGAQVVVDAKTGETILELTAKVDREGRVRCAADISVRNFEAASQLARNRPTLAAVAAPRRETPGLELPPMAHVRQPQDVAAPAERLSPQFAPVELPTIQIDPSELFGAVRQMRLVGTIPIDELDDELSYDNTRDQVVNLLVGQIDDQRGLRLKTRLRRPQQPINLALGIHDGQLDAPASRVIIEPPLEVDFDIDYFLTGPGRLHESGGATLRALTIEEKNGEVRVVPDLDLHDAALVDLPLVESYTKAFLANELAEALLGSKRLPADGQRLMQQLEQLYPDQLSGIVLSSNETPDSQPAPLHHSLSALTEKVRLQKAEFEVSASLAAERINLGNGQSIELRPGSALQIEGTPTAFTVRGHAELGGLRLGSPDIEAALESGSATIEMRVVRPENGEPEITLKIKDLAAARLSATGRAGDVTTKVEDVNVAGGSIIYRSGGTSPGLRLEMPNARASITAKGSASRAGHRARADTIHGHIQGNIILDNGSLEGKLDEVQLEIEGLLVGDRTSESRGSLRVEGGATVRIDEKGMLELSRHGARDLSFNGRFVLPDGSTYEVHRASAQRVAVSAGSPPELRAEQVQADFSCIAIIGEDAEGEPSSVLDLRRGTLAGGIRIGEDGFETIGPVTMSNVDASITNISFGKTGQLGAALKQLDIAGNGMLDVLGGRWRVEGERLPDNKSTLVAKTLADDLHFITEGPKMEILAKPGAKGIGHVLGIEFGGPDGASIALGQSQFEAAVHSGAITVGGEGDVVETLKIADGARVQATVDHLATGSMSEDGKLTLDAEILLNGPVHSRGTSTEGVEVERLEGRVSLLAHLVKGPDEEVAVSTGMRLDGDAELTYQGKLERRADEIGEDLARRSRELIEDK